MPSSAGALGPEGDGSCPFPPPHLTLMLQLGNEMKCTLLNEDYCSIKSYQDKFYVCLYVKMGVCEIERYVFINYTHYEKYLSIILQLYTFIRKKLINPCEGDNAAAFISSLQSRKRMLFCVWRGGKISVFPCFLKLLVVVFVWRVFCTLLPIVWRPCFIVSAPVTFAYNPRQNVHFVMEFCWEFDADQVWCTCSFPSGNQLHIIIIAAVLCCKRCAFQREHGADAVSCSGLIDLQFFLWTTCIFPAKVLPLNSIIDFSSAVCNFSGVGAWAARKIVDHFVHIFLQELTFAAHPSFTAVSICLRAGNGNLRYIMKHAISYNQW